MSDEYLEKCITGLRRMIAQVVLETGHVSISKLKLDYLEAERNERRRLAAKETEARANECAQAGGALSTGVEGTDDREDKGRDPDHPVARRVLKEHPSGAEA